MYFRHVQKQKSNWNRKSVFQAKIKHNDSLLNCHPDLVDVMADNAAKNPYLHSFLIGASPAATRQLLNKVEEEGRTVLPKVIAYAAGTRFNRKMFAFCLSFSLKNHLSLHFHHLMCLNYPFE